MNKKTISICLLIVAFILFLGAGTITPTSNPAFGRMYLMRVFTERYMLNDALIELDDYEVTNVLIEIAREIGFEFDTIEVVRKPISEPDPYLGSVWDMFFPYGESPFDFTPRPYDFHVYIDY